MPRTSLAALLKRLGVLRPRGRQAEQRSEDSWPRNGALRRRVLDSRPRVQRILSENIVPFWLARIGDPEHGGYRLHYNGRGRWIGPAPKYLVSQARTLWFLSRLARDGFGTEPLAQARAGFEFLRTRLWEPEIGFHWAVDHSGTRIVDPSRRVYGQAFALYGISEYARVTGESDPRTLVGQLFEILERDYHDPRAGGYFSGIGPDGMPCDMGAGEKTQNDHLHLLEALTAAAAVLLDPRIRDRLGELLLILTGTVVRKEIPASADGFYRTWAPVLPPECAPVSFGHDIEGVWLLLEATDRLGVGSAVLREHGLSMFKTMLQYGLDRRAGGIWHSGRPGRTADDQRKIWWVQAEGLVGCLDLFARFGQESAAEAYLRILDWVEGTQVDWEWGEWHDTVHPDGRVTGDKAHEWKTPYHAGRAMLECLTRLDRLEALSSPPPLLQPDGDPASS